MTIKLKLGGLQPISWFGIINAVGVILSALLVKQVDPSVLSTVQSTEGQLNSLGQIIGEPIIGLVAAIGSISSGIKASSFLMFPSLILYLIIYRKNAFSNVLSKN